MGDRNGVFWVACNQGADDCQNNTKNNNKILT